MHAEKHSFITSALETWAFKPFFNYAMCI